MKRRRSSRSPTTASSATCSRSCPSSMRSLPSAKPRDFAPALMRSEAMTSDRIETIKNIGVIGAGQMGSGIAHVCALAGYTVKIADLNDAVLQKAIATIDGNLARQVARGRISEEDKNAALQRITTSIDYKEFGDTDFVIEAATERED